MGKRRGSVAARRIVVPICSVAASLWWTFGDRAQTSPRSPAEPSQAGARGAGQGVEFTPLRYGGQFPGDLRHLPDTPSGDHAHHPLLPRPALERFTHPDPAHQTGNFVAPTPGPGGGGDASAGAFEGMSFNGDCGGVPCGNGHPPDTNGDVGPEYYIQLINTSVGVWQKSSGTRLAAFSFNALMSQANFGNNCDADNFGDPVVVYDSFNDRWVITDFAFTLTNTGAVVLPYQQCFAVSKTGDPVAGGWNFYSLAISDLFGDYPKFGVWNNGQIHALFMTANMFNATGTRFNNVRAWALDLAAMEAGASASAFSANLPGSVGLSQVFTGLPAQAHAVTGAPPAGRDETIAVIWSAKLARIWTFHVDPGFAAASLSARSDVTLATWNVAPTTVASPQNPLDTLREELQMQSQYVNIGGTESIWLAHTVANPGNSALTAVRWYQLNVTGGIVSTSGPLQQSTWSPDATVSRFSPSLAVDKLSDMAIGYSATSATLNPAIRWAGRLSTDAAGTLGQTETTVQAGGGSQLGNCGGSTCTRWGDYSAMAIDPNGCDFWYTQEYYQADGLDHHTKIASMRLNPACTPTRFATTIASSPAVGQSGGSTTLSASVTRGGVALAGKTVTFTLNGTSAGSAVTDGTGVATLANASLAGIDAGTYPAGVGASFAGDSAYTASSGTAQLTVTAAAGPQPSAIAAVSGSGTYGSTATLTATLTSGGSGLSGKTVAFTLNGADAGSATTNASGVAAVTAVSLSGVDAGSYASAVGASFAGDTGYTTSSGSGDLTVGKANQAITVGTHAPSSATYQTSFTVAATGGASGNAVTYSSAGACSNVDAVFTMTSGTATCTVKYDQAGNANYNAAAQATESVTAQKADQTITVDTHAPATAVYNTSFSVAGTSSSGLTVAFGGSGACSSAAATFTMTSGTGTCTVAYDQAGDANYKAAAQITEPVAAQKADQTITVGTHAPGTAAYNTSFSVAATAPGGTVSYSSAGACSNAAATFTVTSGTGTCAVNYDQAGNANYNAAAHVSESVAAQKANQTIAVNTHAPATAAYNSIFTVAATAPAGPVSYSSGGACSNGGATFTMTSGSGTCTVAYDQAGDDNYNPAALINESVTAQKATQTIVVGTPAPSSAVYNTSFTVAATGGASGNPVTYGSAGACSTSGAMVTMTSGSGTCTVTYDQAGDANYNAAATVSQSVAAQKAAQTITVTAGAPASAVYNTGFTVSATGGGSGNAITYSSGGACSASGATFAMTSGTGTCTVAYNEAGDANYSAAPQVSESVAAQKASQAIQITVHAPATAVNGSQFTVAATTSSGLQVSFGAAGVCTNVGATFTMTSGSGACTVLYNQAGDSNYSAAPQASENVTAQPGAQKVTPIVTVSSSVNPAAMKTPVFFTAALDHPAASGTVQFVVDGKNFGSPAAVVNGVATSDATSKLNPGTHPVSAVYSGDANFNSATSATLTQTITNGNGR